MHGSKLWTVCGSARLLAREWQWNAEYNELLIFSMTVSRQVSSQVSNHQDILESFVAYQS